MIEKKCETVRRVAFNWQFHCSDSIPKSASLCVSSGLIPSSGLNVDLDDVLHFVRRRAEVRLERLALELLELFFDVRLDLRLRDGLLHILRDVLLTLTQRLLGH